MLNKKDCFLLGRIIRTHGIKGDVIILLDTDSPERYNGLELIFMEEGGQLKERKVKIISLKSNLATVHFNEVDDITNAEALLKSDVFLPLTLLPELGDTNFYFHEVLNFKVIDKLKGEIGVFKQVYEMPQQNIAQIMKGEKEILVPLKAEFIERVDRTSKTLFLNLPEGLVDIYL